MSGAVRWGVLSTAKIGREKVIPAFRAADDTEVVAIGGRDLDRTREVADSLSIPTAHGSYQAVLDDPDVEAVYIPLPNHLHAEWTFRASAAGRHVLCEKPLALGVAEARAMIEACEGQGVLFMEAFMYRLHPTWVAVIESVRSGEIGELVGVQSWFSYFNDDPANIRNVAAFGGGALMDIGCYSVNLSRLLFDAEPTAVSGAVLRDPETGCDTVTSAVLDFGAGSATFTCSTRAEPDQRVHVHGTKGRIEIDIPFNIPADRATHITVFSGRTPRTGSTRTFDPCDQYRVQAEAFGAAVRGAVPLPIAPTDGIANMAVIERVFATAR